MKDEVRTRIYVITVLNNKEIEKVIKLVET